MKFQQAVKALANGSKPTNEIVQCIVAEVESRCQTSTDNIDDWIGAGSYTGRETPQSIAREWDSLSAEA